MFPFVFPSKFHHCAHREYHTKCCGCKYVQQQLEFGLWFKAHWSQWKDSYWLQCALALALDSLFRTCNDYSVEEANTVSFGCCSPFAKNKIKYIRKEFLGEKNYHLYSKFQLLCYLMHMYINTHTHLWTLTGNHTCLHNAYKQTHTLSHSPLRSYKSH